MIQIPFGTANRTCTTVRQVAHVTSVIKLSVSLHRTLGYQEVSASN